LAEDRGGDAGAWTASALGPDGADDHHSLPGAPTDLSGGGRL